jgi:hypothetical protein
LPAGAGAVIMNCGFGSGSGSLLFYQRFEEVLYTEKVIVAVAEECKNIKNLNSCCKK